MPDPFEVARMMAAALASGAFTAVLARAFVMRAVRELEETVKGMGTIRTELATITLRLEMAEKSQELLQSVDRRVISLEARLNGGKHPSRPSPS